MEYNRMLLEGKTMEVLWKYCARILKLILYLEGRFRTAQGEDKFPYFAMYKKERRELTW